MWSRSSHRAWYGPHLIFSSRKLIFDPGQFDLRSDDTEEVELAASIARAIEDLRCKSKLLLEKKLDISNSQPNARLESNSGNHLLRTDFFEKFNSENDQSLKHV